MYQDYKDLLSAFHAHGVRYLIVGGYAVIFHAQPRFTKDIDLFIKADRANAEAAYVALADFGAPLQGIRPEDFVERGTFLRFGRERGGLVPGADDPRPLARPTSPEGGVCGALPHMPRRAACASRSARCSS